MNLAIISLTFMLVCETSRSLAKNGQKTVIDDLVEIKDFKKLIRTQTNVLVCFTSSPKKSSSIIKVFREAAEAIKGHGTMVLVDCSGEAKKLCKKLKVSPANFALKHYKDGEFHKDYDRKETVSSMVNFMRDPGGDMPWEEDSTASDVIHIRDAPSLAKYLRKETKPVMVMFYAPWCGFCKTLKPEFSAAATDLKGHSVMAAIDVNKPENGVITSQFNITGFPTLLYFQNGVMKYLYEGENNRAGLVSFMRNPKAAPVKVKEPEWSDVDSEVVHLNTDSFGPVLKEEGSALVMFYAPWCGHCKRMKPEYEKAAAIMKAEKISGMLAAVDATKEQAVAEMFKVKGYPTVKYFTHGEFRFDVNVRESQKIVDFMKDPREPPPPPPPEKPWAEEESEVVHLMEDSYKPFLKKKKHVLVMFYAPWCGHCKRAKPEYTAAAEEFKDDPKVAFAAIDCTMQQSLCSFNDIKGYPTFKYFNYYKTSFMYDGERVKSGFVRFMHNPANDKTVQKTSDVKGSDFTGTDVIELSDQNFDKELKDRQYTFVLFHAPWCHVCKMVKQNFIKAAEALKKDGVSVTLAGFDCNENSEVAEHLEIAGFPIFKLFNRDKFVEDYAGQRDEQDFVTYLTNKLKGKDEL